MQLDDVPEVVRRNAEASGAAAWLAALPEVVRSLAQDWSLQVGAVYPDATEALVVAVVRADGTTAVLKVLMPRDDGRVNHEPTVLRLAAGEGCARLYAHDVERGALLVERLGRSMVQLGLPVQQRHALLCDAASRLWRPAPDVSLVSGAEKGRWLIDRLLRSWEALGRPCSARAVDHAVTCAERRIAAHDDERARLVHGDVHQWNALEDPVGGGFKLVDPDGLLAEPEYDLGIIMREDPVELLDGGDPRDRARWLAARTGLDAAAIWEWGVIERLSTALLGLEIGLQPVADQMLAAAEAIAADAL